MSEPSQIPTESAAAARSSIVVGYSSKAEGRAALKRAVSEAKLRGSDLIVVHTSADVELERPACRTGRHRRTARDPGCGRQP